MRCIKKLLKHKTMEVILMNNRDTNSLKRVIKETITSYKIESFIVLVLIIASSIANVYGSMFLKSLIDDYIVPLLSQTVPNYVPLLNALMKLVMIYGVGILATYGFNRIMVTISLGTLKHIRDELFEHMQTLPLRFFDTHAHGDIMSVYTNDTDTLRQLISQSIPQVIVSLMTIISVTISMFILNVPLAVLTIACGLLMVYTSKKISAKSGKYFIAQQKQLGIENGFIEEMMEGSKVIKVFTHEEQSIKDFDQVNDALFEASANANTFANVLMPVVMNIGYISYVLIAVVGSIFAMNNIAGLTLGGIAAFLQLNRSFTNPIGQISMQLNAVIMADAGAKRIYEIIDTESEVDDGVVALEQIDHDHWAWRHPRKNGQDELVPLRGDVRFENVNFSYNPDKQILFDVSLFAKPGQKIAFVGATGAGKTTITNLINRFYDIQSGSITYDGIDVKLIKKADLRKSLGIVLQDTNLFTGTIMDNIRYGRLDASDEECIAASKLSNAHEFIKHLEHGYDTMIHAGGESLSQGQRQLLSIARAAVANPPVLILDEATSSIDTHTERIVQEGMDKLMEGRTVFVIAHRLSTIQNSDAIMVLEQGHIIERGNHEDLLKQKGKYYQLYTGAFELD